MKIIMTSLWLIFIDAIFLGVSTDIFDIESTQMLVFGLFYFAKYIDIVYSCINATIDF